MNSSSSPSDAIEGSKCGTGRQAPLQGTMKYIIYNNPVQFVVLRKKGIKQFINMITNLFRPQPPPLFDSSSSSRMGRSGKPRPSVGRYHIAVPFFCARSRVASRYYIHQYQASSVRLNFHSILNHRLYSLPAPLLLPRLYRSIQKNTLRYPWRRLVLPVQYGRNPALAYHKAPSINSLVAVCEVCCGRSYVVGRFQWNDTQELDRRVHLTDIHCWK